MAKPGLRKIKCYTESFRISAVRLSLMPGVMVQSVAAALDIHPFMLSRWRTQYREAAMRKPSNYAIKRDLRRNTGLKPSFPSVGPLFWLLGKLCSD